MTRSHEELSMKLRYAGTTHVGMKRKHNEDNLVMVPERRLYVVADGMGGHACGEVASKISVETMVDFFNGSAEDDDLTWPCKISGELSHLANMMNASVKLANMKIFEKAESDVKFKGMGTTIVAIAFREGEISMAHVGHSRIYRLRDETLTQMTEDHSLLNDYKKMANLTEEEIENFPHKNIIVRALGMKDSVEVDVQSAQTKPGDVYLLCSDGLSGEITDDDMAAILLAHRDNMETACTRLIEDACANGGKDNVTAILVQVVGEGDSA